MYLVAKINKMHIRVILSIPPKIQIETFRLLPGLNLKMSQPDPIFVDINPDQPVTRIESVCISCFKSVIIFN